MRKILPKVLPKIFVILGPTASGKSDLAVALARKINGEVVSADSRQVYKGLNIGSGKITKKEMRGVRHHLLDVVSPKLSTNSSANSGKRFSVDDFQKLAYKTIDDIISRGKFPVICGGTGFYIQAIVDGILLPDVQPNNKLREKLNKKTITELYKELKKIDPERAKNIERKNKIRLIRALEIAKALGKSPDLFVNPKYDALQIGISFPNEILKQRIEKRLNKRLKQGMLNEAKSLHKKGLSWKRMGELGLEYKYMALHLQGKITRDEMMKEINLRSLQYAKKQMFWFKRDKRVWWLEIR